MGEVDLIDAAVATCRVKFKGKKWWWAHYTNTLAVIMGAAWRIFVSLTKMKINHYFTFCVQ